MIRRGLALLRGDGTRSRALRSTGMTALSAGGSNLLRLASNLVLTRLLFPEAFGLMALVQVFVYGLQTFSQIGIHTILVQSKRDDQVFLNTLWTMQIIRGILLWLMSCIIAVPAAQIYGQPELAYLLPVTALAMVVRGFRSTREPQAMRALKLERVIPLQLGSQFAGLVVMALLAWWLQSVWALAIGNVITALITLFTMNTCLPGLRNRVCWDREVVRSSLNFGVFLLLSSMSTFFNNMGAQMMLGAYIPIAMFGFYNIARQLANLPGILAMMVAQNVIFPLYRIAPPQENRENQRNVFKARRLVGIFAIGITASIALTGDWIIYLLFDANYEMAGPIMVLLALAALPVQGLMGVQEALTGSGDSKRHFYLSLIRAIVLMILLGLFIPSQGLVAAAVMPSLAILLVYPYQAMLTHRYRAWDKLGEISLVLIGCVLALAIGWLKWGALEQVFFPPS